MFSSTWSIVYWYSPVPAATILRTSFRTRAMKRAAFMTDAEGIRNLVGTGLVQLTGSVVTALFALAYLFYLNWYLTCITIVALAAFGGAMDHPKQHGIDIDRDGVGGQRLFGSERGRDRSLIDP